MLDWWSEAEFIQQTWISFLQTKMKHYATEQDFRKILIYIS